MTNHSWEGITVVIDKTAEEKCIQSILHTIHSRLDDRFAYLLSEYSSLQHTDVVDCISLVCIDHNSFGGVKVECTVGADKLASSNALHGTCTETLAAHLDPSSWLEVTNMVLT